MPTQHQQGWQVPLPPQWATASQLPSWPGTQQQFGATPLPAGDDTPRLAQQAPWDWYTDTVPRGGHRPEPTAGYAAGAQFSGATAACQDNAPFHPDAAFGLFQATTNAATTARPTNLESQAARPSQAFTGPFAAPYSTAPRPSLVLPPRSAFTGRATRQAPDTPRPRSSLHRERLWMRPSSRTPSRAQAKWRSEGYSHAASGATAEETKDHSLLHRRHVPECRRCHVCEPLHSGC
jgi:hypothetical protein